MDCTSQDDNGFSWKSLPPPLAPVIFPLAAARLVFQGSGQLELDTEIVNDLCSLLLAARLLPAALVVFAELIFPFLGLVWLQFKSREMGTTTSCLLKSSKWPQRYRSWWMLAEVALSKEEEL